MPERRHRPTDEVSAGGVVVRQTAGGWEVCLIRVGDRWSVPKGWVEPGETPDQAALREIAEETGLPADHLRIISALSPSKYVYRREGTLVFKHVHHFLVLVAGDAPLHHQVEEVDEAAWFRMDVAEETVAYPDLRTALAEAQRWLASGSLESS